MTHVHAHGGGQGEAGGEDSSLLRLVVTLATAGALAGLLVAWVYEITLPPIEKHKAQVMAAALGEVLKEPVKLDTLYLVKGKLVTKVTEEVAETDRAFLGYDASGKMLGAAVVAREPGFLEEVGIMVGFDPASGTLVGIKILDQKETPGLGDKIERDSGFTRQFAQRVAPVKAVKTRRGDDKSEIDAISGATISSRAVVRIVNHAVEKWQPLLAQWKPGVTP